MFLLFFFTYIDIKENYFMRKLLPICLTISLLSGCTNADAQYKTSSEQKPAYSYEYEDVEATITKIDVRSWFAQCPRWSWNISVEYDDMLYDDNGYAQGAFNRPKFTDKHVGDTTTARLKITYIDGVEEETCIDKIYK